MSADEDTNTVRACPECDTAGVTPTPTEESSGAYRCTYCGESFNDYVERPPAGAAGRNGLARILADPDVTSIEDARDAADGPTPGMGYLDHPWRDRAVLRELYVDRRMTTAEVADELGCSKSTVIRWLHRHDIEIRRRFA